MVRTAPPLTFVVGGARSGKSAYAESLIKAYPAPWAYVATGQAFDEEMLARIAEHQARRDGRWQTIDAPIEVPAALARIPSDMPVLLDCLTLWTSNLLLDDRDITAATDALLSALGGRQGPAIAVANETGLGIVPDNALARRFRDEAGRMNQRVAALAANVVFMVAGLPMVLKGTAQI